MDLLIEPVTLLAAYCIAERVSETEARVFFTISEVRAYLLFHSLGHTEIDRSCKHQEVRLLRAPTPRDLLLYLSGDVQK